MVNKRGGIPPTVMLIAMIFIAFFLIIIFGFGSYMIGKFSEVLDTVNITYGSYSFHSIYNETMSVQLSKLKGNTDMIGISVLLGMILVMGFVGFLFRQKKAITLIADIGIIIISEVITVIIQNQFLLIVNSSDLMYEMFVTNMEKSATFLMNLHIIIPIVGVLIFIVHYASINKEPEVNPDVY